MLFRACSAIPRNLLLRFKDDSIDDSNTLAQLLQTSPGLGEMLDISVRTLPGDHLRVMQQAVVDLPPEVARVASTAVATGGDLIGKRCSVKPSDFWERSVVVLFTDALFCSAS